MVWRCVGFLVLAFVLSGCLSGQKRQAAACTMEARRLYSSAVPAVVAQQLGYARNCMEMAGYQLDAGGDRDCLPDGRYEENAYCYIPKGFFAQLTLPVELFIARNL